MSEQDAPAFNAALVITATATATHPDGAEVPPVPAAEDTSEE